MESNSLPPGGFMLVLTTVGVVIALATLWYTRKDYQLSIKESGGADEDPNETSLVPSYRGSLLVPRARETSKNHAVDGEGFPSSRRS